MSKILLFICGVLFLLWFINFDSKAYLENRNQQKEEEQTTIENAPPEIINPSFSTLLFPVKGKKPNDIISFYGEARGGGKRIHEGVDIPAERGTSVLAVTDGTIVKVANKGSGGKQVWLKSETNGQTYFYAHLDSWTVGQGQLVKKGERVGTVGNTGNAKHTLPHLHFGIYVGRSKTTDPLPFLK